MPWRLANSLVTFRDQLNRAYPNRSKHSDGYIRNAAHKKKGKESDHYPWVTWNGQPIVTAADFTKDIPHGVDTNRITDELQRSRDNRIKYVISNGLIMFGDEGPDPWVWSRRPDGSDYGHHQHMHISVKSDAQFGDDGRPWNIPSFAFLAVQPDQVRDRQRPHHERRSRSEPVVSGILNQPVVRNIAEIQQTKIIEGVQFLKSQPEFCLQIPSVIFKMNTVTIHYIKKNLGDKVVIDAARDVLSIKQVVEEVVGDANIELIELNEMPRFQPTAGLGSSLIRTDKLNVVHRVGCITALLIDATATKNFALTVGHTVEKGQVICIVQGDYTHREIGIVHKRKVKNKDGAYIDAALIKLYENSVEDLQLKQKFIIDDTTYRLAALEVESLEERRVILRAIDNDDTRGFVSTVSLNILEGADTPMLRCAQIMRYHENDQHRDAIHSEGQSGLLCTAEPIPQSGNIVKPLVLLIGLYPEYNARGEYVCQSSVGVDLRRVLDYLSRSVGETLTINAIDI